MITHDQKREQLAALLRHRIGKPRYAPLSFAQERLWFLTQFSSSSVYNIPMALRLEGRLDLEALERSFTEIVKRHEILRTSIQSRNGAPMQAIAPPFKVQIPFLDLRHLKSGLRDAEVRRLAAELYQQEFDLAVPPLWRLKVLQLEDHEYVLLLTLHHIISDGWSMGILIRELSAFYSRSNEIEAQLPALPVQYADYARWQRKRLQGRKLESELDYWRKQLEGAPRLLEFPVDRKRGVMQDFSGSHCSFELSRELSGKVKALAVSENSSLFMVLLAAFQILLGRYSRQNDVCIGTPIAGRSHGQVQELIGFFINMLVLRTRLEGNPDFQTVLRRTRESALQAYAHQDLPFELLVEGLHVPRETSYTPVFQAVFAFQNFLDNQPPRIDGLKIESLPLEVDQVKFDLSLTMAEADDRIVGSFEYRRSLFDSLTIARWSHHFLNLLEDALKNPDKKIEQLCLLDSTERQQLLFHWREQKLPDLNDVNLNLADRFLQQVMRTPDNVALVHDNESLTYTELNAQASKLAHYLRRCGVGPDVVVGLAMDRCAELVIGILAILKAGGAYLPLDKDYPVERLKYMLHDTGAALVLTASAQQRHWLQEAGAIGDLPVVVLQEEQEKIFQESPADPAPLAHSDNLAYVIYTSGSTGPPKGVMVTHRNVLRLFEQVRRWFDFNEEDVWTLFHSFAFDFSVWELWGALLYGGRLVIVPYWISRSPDEFHALLVKQSVTVLNQTPSAFRQLMYADRQSPARSELKLRYVIFGGEALEPKSLGPWLEAHGDATPQLVNMYGITETTVHVTYCPITADDIRDGAGSCIGSAIPDLQMYILDPGMEPVSIGVTGELFVGGTGVARGYMKQPVLTAQKFVPDPFGVVEGGRLYRTGDLARRLPNGDVEYVGRDDQQVKIRGFRIELGEIEAALLAHPGIREAVVVVREEEKSEKRLIAFIAGTEDTQLTATEIRDYLKQRLPDHMVPAAFMMLGRLPLTPNGKVDRDSLTGINAGVRLGAGSSLAPSNHLESALTEIWTQVLGVRNIGVEDNFFASGGDSILSLRVVARAHEQGIHFSLPQLFQYQTVRELARKIAEMGDTAPGAEIQPFALISVDDRSKLPPGILDAYPLSRLQMGMLYHNNLNPAIYHNVHMRRIRGRLNEQELRQALEDVISQHPILRTSFDLSSYSEPLQLVHEKVDFPLEINRLRGNSQSEKEQELAELLSHEKNTPVDWSRAPLLRVRVDYLDDHTFHLMLAEHHAIFDGWSVASFCAEWFERYWSRVNGRSTEIKQGQNPFRDYVFRERQALQSLEDLEFWTEHVADTAPTRLSQRSFIDKEAKAGDVFRANIPPEISEGLKRAARLASVPIKSMLLAAHLRVLSFVSGQKEVITGVVTHGRPETANSDRALGLFLNALPVRKMLNGGTWTKLGRELFELERRIFPHRYYPSVELQQKLGRGELFETTFNFTYFHVYKEMEGISDWELQESRSTALTNLPLSANFTLEPGSGELRLDLAPAAGRFSITQVQTLLAFYERALTDIARNPEGTYESNLLSDDQSKQLLEEWQGQKIQFKQANHLARLFEDQVRRIPNAIALSCHDRVWTYAELNQKANRLARFLCRQGIAPEVIVGVAIERSAELVITLMAILKAGGAYLPLDLESPLPRLRYMLQNSEAKLVLSWKPMGFPPEISSSFQTVRFLNLSDHEGAFERESGDNFENGACTDNLAYVIYTSGSTGVPKGVMVRHAALINHMLWMAQCFNWNQQTRILLKTPITFDASVWEFLAPLVSGAVLVIGPPDAHQDFSVLVQTIRSQSITVLQMVPSALKFLLQEPHFGDCSSLKFVFCGGEEVAPSLLEQLWKQNLVEFGNLYGPTECTIDALYWTGSPGANVPQVPIGRPLPNIEAYVLNQDMELVPPGTSGEIYLGGAGLARGYFGRADLTAEKFVPNPLDSNGGARLYRTGDHGVWSLEGQLHFCGRTDQQVKIHGFRIEIGEIEEVLHRLEQVKEAAVVSRTVDGDPRLLSYVVLKSNVDNPGRAIERITAHLQQNLPRYMVPANTIIMNELPRLSNGKLDRKKLPLPDAETLQNQIDYVAPRTAVEARVAAIWADLLGGGRIGIHDDFFVRGGHSLLAIQAMSMLEKEFAVELSLNTLFEAPTVATLAQKIEELKRPPEPVYKAHYHIPELHAPTHN